jgi:regulator of cell morphogenesis and NO signaling
MMLASHSVLSLHQVIHRYLYNMNYPDKRSIIKPGHRMAELIYANPSLLLLLENLEIDFLLHDYTVSQVCRTSGIDEKLFILLGNLYNGHLPSQEAVFSINPVSLLPVINFLKRCHDYYKEEQYPAIKELIEELNHHNQRPELRMVEQFFKGYFEEVLEHLDYEDEIAFPYLRSLLEGSSQSGQSNRFSVQEYRDHHSDIETKLSDLKALLLQHIEVENDRRIRRRLLMQLAELESDLVIHSLIEEQILIPFVEQIEKGEGR